MEKHNFLTIGKLYRSIRLRTYLVWLTISIVANLCDTRTGTTFFITSYLSMIVWLMLLFNHDRNKVERCLIFLIHKELSPWNKAIIFLMPRGVDNETIHECRRSNNKSYFVYCCFLSSEKLNFLAKSYIYNTTFGLLRKNKAQNCNNRGWKSSNCHSKKRDKGPFGQRGSSPHRKSKPCTVVCCFNWGWATKKYYYFTIQRIIVV